MRGFWSQIAVAFAVGVTAIGIVYVLHGLRVESFDLVMVAQSIEEELTASEGWQRAITGISILIGSLAVSLFGFFRGMARVMWFWNRRRRGSHLVTDNTVVDGHFLTGRRGKFYQSWLHINEDGSAREMVKKN